MNEEIVMYLSSAADRWERTHPIIGFGELRVHDALRDAVRCIEETSAKVPKWIKTKDKLPPRELKVLAVNGHGHIKVMAFWKKEKERWTWIENSRFTHQNDITHWMPLPSTEGLK